MEGLTKRMMDLTGHKYNMLTVLSFHSKTSEYNKWICSCDCGRECVKYGHLIRAGQTISCGCEKIRRSIESGKRNAASLVGKRFGRLVVIERDNGYNKHKKAMWLLKVSGKTHGASDSERF